MILKWLFDRVVSLVGLLILWPVLLIVAILIKVKMPGGPAFFVQKRVGKGGKLFDCHKFRTMRVPDGSRFLDEPSGKAERKVLGRAKRQSRAQGSRLASDNDNKNASTGSATAGWSTVSVAGDSRITPFGAKLRHWKLDELPGLWDVLRGKMSFVGPRPDVPGYADKLTGEDRDVLKLRPGITGPATLKYRLEDEMIATWVQGSRLKVHGSGSPKGEKFDENLFKSLPENIDEMTDQELAVWYNDNVIYPDKVRLNCYYYRHYSFIKDIQMIFCTVLGKKMKYAGEEI